MILLLLKIDKNKLLLFAPLKGITAKEELKGINPKVDSLVFLENFQSSKKKALIRSKAVFRLFWLLGGIWRLIGWTYILPPFFCDWVYVLIAKNRSCPVKNRTGSLQSRYKQRFLP